MDSRKTLARVVRLHELTTLAIPPWATAQILVPAPFPRLRPRDVQLSGRASPCSTGTTRPRSRYRRTSTREDLRPGCYAPVDNFRSSAWVAKPVRGRHSPATVTDARASEVRSPALSEVARSFEREGRHRAQDHPGPLLPG